MKTLLPFPIKHLLLYIVPIDSNGQSHFVSLNIYFISTGKTKLRAIRGNNAILTGVMDSGSIPALWKVRQVLDNAVAVELNNQCAS